MSFGIASFSDLGILPDTNVAYRVAEFAAYETIMLFSYLKSWAGVSDQPQIAHLRDPLGFFCPAVTNVAEAQRYGINFILEPPGDPGPPGTHLVALPGGEGLYRVDNVSLATAVPMTIGTPSPAVETDLRVKPAQPNNVAGAPERGSFVKSSHLRLTNVPGWGTPLGGRPPGDADVVARCHASGRRARRPQCVGAALPTACAPTQA